MVKVFPPRGVALGKPEPELAKQAGGELETSVGGELGTSVSRGRRFAGEAVEVYSSPGVAAGKPEPELAKQAGRELEVSMQAELEIPWQAGEEEVSAGPLKGIVSKPASCKLVSFKLVFTICVKGINGAQGNQNYNVSGYLLPWKW